MQFSVFSRPCSLGSWQSQLKLKRFSLFAIIYLIAIGFSFAQFEIPTKPTKANPDAVYDYYNLLSASQKQSLEQKLIKYSDTTSTQIVVAIIASTKGENINYLGANWLTEWGIGQAKEDNGVLIILARDDRRIAINTGYGVEHLLTDAISKRIIERDIIPYFKQNNYYGGLNRGIDAIFEVMNGEYQGTRQSNNSTPFPFGLIVFLFFIFVIILIAISKNRRDGGGSSGRTGGVDGRDLLEAIILSNMGRGSYRRGSSGWGRSSGGGWSSGGGFGGGFGGGAGGGGGASGGW
ncbi:MAG: TPM domain-containing protein [Jejuia sp.]